MNDTKQHFYKTLNAIVGTNRIDNEEAYIINDYISRLEATIKDEQEQLDKQKEVLDKIKEYIKINMEEYGGDIYLTCKEIEELLEEIE